MASKKEQEWLLNEKYGGKKTPQYEADLDRLASGEPLAYVINNMPFLGCSIDLSSRPLIPRAETEFWVGEVVEKLKKESGPITCIDIFAGSGCIGVSLLKLFQVEFTKSSTGDKTFKSVSFEFETPEANIITSSLCLYCLNAFAINPFPITIITALL